MEGQHEGQQTSAVFKKALIVSLMQLIFTYKIPKDHVTPGMACKRKTLSASKTGGLLTLLLSTMSLRPLQTIPKALTLLVS